MLTLTIEVDAPAGLSLAVMEAATDWAWPGGTVPSRVSRAAVLQWDRNRWGDSRTRVKNLRCKMKQIHQQPGSGG